MKYGKFLGESKKLFDESWRSHFLDYKLLKQLVKKHRIEIPIDLKGGGSSNQLHCPSFPELVSERVAFLQGAAKAFFSALDKEVLKCNAHYEGELEKCQVRLEKESGSSSAELLNSLLHELSALESFVFLNYNAVFKILKKHEKIAGLDLKKTYLSRMACLSFSKTGRLEELRREVEAHLERIEGADSAERPSKRGKIDGEGTPRLLQTRSAAPSQKVLVTLTGIQGTNIFNSAMRVISGYDCALLDISFSRIEHNLIVGILLEIKQSHVLIFKDLIEAGSKFDALVNFDLQTGRSLQRESFLEEAPYGNRENYVATLINENGLKALTISEVTKILLEHKVSVLRGTQLTRKTFRALELKLGVPENLDLGPLKEKLFALSNQHRTDISLQKDDIYRRVKRVAVFDMDSTLIQQEVIDELARHAGKYEEVRAITEEAMRGELDFEQSLRKRVSTLEGVSSGVIEEVRKIIQFTEGARTLCHCLKRLGIKLAVVSGGFIPLAKYVKKELSLDFAFANTLEFSGDGQTLTGKVTGPIVDAKRKAELLRTIAQMEGVEAEQVIAVGDGANDLLMLGAAGLGVAFNAKPKVQKEAQHRINQKSLINVLYLMGLNDDDITSLVSP